MTKTNRSLSPRKSRSRWSPPATSSSRRRFQNTIEDIQNAFKPFFEVTGLEANSDPNQIYELEARLKTFGILDHDEIERFAETFYKGALDTHDAPGWNAWSVRLSFASTPRMT